MLGHFAAELGEIAPELAAVVSAWPGLPEPIKVAIVAMVRSTKTE